jgi:hypothetical protein
LKKRTKKLLTFERTRWSSAAPHKRKFFASFFLKKKSFLAYIPILTSSTSATPLAIAAKP